MGEEFVIEVKELTKKYKKQVVVNKASFRIQKGRICGLIGPNGAGKTTIMKSLGGLIMPTEGTMQILGGTTPQELAKARERMSFMIETPYAKQDLTAWQNLEKQRLQKGIPNKERIKEVMEQVGLADVGKKKIKEFSLGMKQRFGLANALMGKPEIMVLDEPINGLDPEGIVEIRELLKKVNQEQETTILISSHILSELSLMCDEYLFIAHGQIIKHLTHQQLLDECRSHFHIHTDNDSMALAILQEKLQVQEYEVERDGSINLYEQLEDTKKISQTLYENGVVPLELRMGGDTLEQYYMTLIGGAEYVECN